jgi:pimeloyl-ACP methyl ester carboxylesterase
MSGSPIDDVAKAEDATIAARRLRSGRIARGLRWLLLAQLGLALGLSIVTHRFWHLGESWTGWLLALGCGVGLVLLLRMLITAQNFFTASRFGSVAPPGYRLNWRQKLRLFGEEFQATMISSSWSMHRHAFAKRLANQSRDYPVLLIHGYVCNSGYWHAMSRVLTREQIHHCALDLEPVFGNIEDYVPQVARAIETLCAELGAEKVIIVAHSMGGLVARAYLRAHGSTRIARVITIGTPHHGTNLAYWGPGVNSRQMRWSGGEQQGASGSWLSELAASESAATRALITSIYSYHDNIVVPQLSGYLAGANNLAVHGIGHVALALNPSIQNMVLAEIRGTRTS